MNNQIKPRSKAVIDWRKVLNDSAKQVYKEDENKYFPLDFDPMPNKHV